MVPELKSILKSIDLSDKEIAVYSAILPLGTATVRILTTHTGINRGTVHDILEGLAKKGMVISEERGSKHRFSVASPDKILLAMEDKERIILEQKKKVASAIPQLMSMYAKQGGRPHVEYYDSDEGIKSILEDVLETVSKNPSKEYIVYSSKSLRNYLYKLFPNFTKEKIKRKIKTKVIALGEGGDPANMQMAERKWLSDDAPAYILIYGSKVALISVAEDKSPFGVLIRDEKIATTQKILFGELWAKI